MANVSFLFSNQISVLNATLESVKYVNLTKTQNQILSLLFEVQAIFERELLVSLTILYIRAMCNFVLIFFLFTEVYSKHLTSTHTLESKCFDLFYKKQTVNLFEFQIKVKIKRKKRKSKINPLSNQFSRINGYINNSHKK